MASKSIKWILALLLPGGGTWLFYTKVYIPETTYETVTAKTGDLNLTAFGSATASGSTSSSTTAPSA